MVTECMLSHYSRLNEAILSGVDSAVRARMNLRLLG